jgi:hypothetical protein
MLMVRRASVVLDKESIKDREPMFVLDHRDIKELGDKGITICVVVFVRVVDGSKIKRLRKRLPKKP